MRALPCWIQVELRASPARRPAGRRKWKLTWIAPWPAGFPAPELAVLQIRSCLELFTRNVRFANIFQRRSKAARGVPRASFAHSGRAAAWRWVFRACFSASPRVVLGRQVPRFVELRLLRF